MLIISPMFSLQYDIFLILTALIMVIELSGVQFGLKLYA